jgi:transketolase
MTTPTEDRLRELKRLAVQLRRLLTAEDHTIIGGLGGAVAEILGERRPTLLKRLGLRDCFGESAPNDDLLEKYGLTPAHMAAAAVDLLAVPAP